MKSMFVSGLLIVSCILLSWSTTLSQRLTDHSKEVLFDADKSQPYGYRLDEPDADDTTITYFRFDVDDTIVVDDDPAISTWWESDGYDSYSNTEGSLSEAYYSYSNTEISPLNQKNDMIDRLLLIFWREKLLNDLFDLITDFLRFYQASTAHSTVFEELLLLMKFEFH
mmetsp:Transcript_5212/g.7349  ORF Transcript_5212/g.7349 Transcript_5212/m.7349 type:complete len:168 (+) Transcript_5212:166-669(+)